MNRRRCLTWAGILNALLLLTLGWSASAASVELTRDGVTDYRICVPLDASPQVASAAETLRHYLHEVSGADFEIVSGPTNEPHRIIFMTGLSTDPSPTRGCGEDGFRIWSQGADLYLMAETAQGLRNSVYTFVETYLGCRKYSPTVEVVPHRPSISLPPIDDTQVPALSFRLQDLPDSSYAAWHKLSSRSDWGLFVHTFKVLVPPEVYFREHPEYFSENAGVRVADAQLCLTNPDVFRIVVDGLQGRMSANPGARFWSVSQNDTYVPCGCASCVAVDRAEGSPAGSLLSFVNRVAGEFPDKTISTLAYQYSRAAPAHLQPAPNVNIMLCSIECNRSRPIAADPGSASFVKDVQDWARLTGNIFLWDYVIQYRNLVSPFPNLRVLQPNIQFFVENGITSVFEQGISSMQGEFAELRVYLISKLLWDPYLNFDVVLDDFLDGYYGAAAPHLRRYIDAMHDALERSGEDLSCYGYPYPSANGYLSAAMLDTYGKLFDEAEAAVAGDPEVLERVQTARLPLQYALLEQAKILGDDDRGFFETSVTGARRVRPAMAALLETFADRCERAGVTKLEEHGIPPSEYRTSTKRFLESSIQQHLALYRPAAVVIPASPKYHNGEVSALTDGFTGWNDYHMHWLGFEGEEMDATIDLGPVGSISRIETEFLQDIDSWVFFPQAVEFLVSEDGSRFTSIGTLAGAIPPERSGSLVAPYNLRFEPVQARYVRVKTTSMRTCPRWHKGAGGKAWIFIDEIRVF